MIKSLSEIFFRWNNEKPVNNFTRTINVLLLMVLFWTLLYYAFNKLNYRLQPEVFYKYRYKFISWFTTTLIIASFSLLISLFLWIILNILGQSRFLPFHYFNKLYIEIVRWTPFLVQIYFYFYIIATALDLNNRLVLWILILSFFHSAYISEIIRAWIESIDKTNIEASKSIWLNKFQMYRFILIPQIIKRSLPPITWQFASLIKDSSLLSVIAISELTKNVLEVDSITFTTFEDYFALAILYLIMTLPLSYISRKLEKKFDYEH